MTKSDLQTLIECKEQIRSIVKKLENLDEGKPNGLAKPVAYLKEAAILIVQESDKYEIY